MMSPPQHPWSRLGQGGAGVVAFTGADVAFSPVFRGIRGQ